MAFMKLDNGELLKNIRRFAKKNGLTLAEVATLAGLSVSAIYSWKQHTPSKGTLKEVAQVLGTSYAKLVGKGSRNDQVTAVDLKKVVENQKNEFEYNGQPVSPAQLKIIRNVLKTMFERGQS
ncbi:XRE family transcriptional regulator [Lactobacillus sp. CBA3605]|uniref:helix-turn-helix domain-containing protein n=1 Tax=Lactobacillus sp. CBA3605 TaxID=2099788 RepID=UPI000CFB78F6|nr:helix-turn-helix transcriptional regulator [Lactobacillus sp. CBA3605]AVK62267.1 XRE family transcriptional regulator [Lactobacillus sp. CBA3605]